MEATIERYKVKAKLQQVDRGLSQRSPKPILQNVKLQTTPETTTLVGTDLEVGIRVEIAGLQVDVPGTVLLPIGRFGAILRESSDANLYLESDGAKTQVRGERREFHLPTENPDEFPDVVQFDEDKYPHVGARVFRELIRRPG